MAQINPLSFAECKLALLADRNVVLTSGIVSGVNDSSSQLCNAAQSDVGLRPFYSTAPYKSLLWKNTGASMSRLDLSNSATFARDNMSILVIGRTRSLGLSNSVPAAQLLIDGASATSLSIGTQGTMTCGNGSTFFRSQLRPPSSICVMALVTTATSATFYVDNDTEQLNASFSGTDTLLYVGNNLTSTTPFAGDICEVYAYQGKRLSASEIAGIVEYARAKYGRQTETLRVVADGSSSMLGQASTGWCRGPIALLESRFTAASLYNFAFGGETTSDMLADFNLEVAAVYRSGIENVLLIQPGSNDLYASGLSAVQAFDVLKNYCLRSQEIGYKVVVRTILPRGTVGAAANTQRVAYNELVRAAVGTFIDAVSDVAALPEFDYDGAQDDLNFYNADAVHLNDNGFALEVDTDEEAIRRALGLAYLPPALTTRAKVLTQLGVTADAIGEPATDLIDELINDVSSAIGRYCNRIDEDGNHTFGLTSYTELLNGTGMPQVSVYNPPISALTSVRIVRADGTGETVAASEYRYDGASGVLTRVIDDTFFYPTSRSHGIGNDDRFPGYYVAPIPRWPEGFNNIEVTYTGGWQTIPADLQRVATQIVCQVYLNRRTNPQAALDVVGNRTTSYRGVASVVSLYHSMLSPYIRMGV